MAVKTIRTIKEMAACSKSWHRDGLNIALVPTMGALHEGHLSLVHHAKQHADKVIVSIFVNPAQFNDKEDLKKYPRTEEEDRDKLVALDVDVIYAPDAEEMYPPLFSTNVTLTAMSDILCGTNRPGHFDGVATIVTKLFLQTHADMAQFGEKDFQQLSIVRQLVADLNIPIEIIGRPTIREADGLAMSSRNMRLSKEHRKIAPKMHEFMQWAKERVISGNNISETLAKAREEIKASGFEKIDYLELRAKDNLENLSKLDRPARLLAAAWLGDVRLIDNIAVKPE